MKTNRIFLTLGGIGLLVLLLFIVFGANRSNYNWKEDYKKESVDPYGLFVADELLRKQFESWKFSVLTDSLAGLSNNDPYQKGANYVFIGGGMYLSTNDVTELLSFVEKGHTALISSRSLPYQLATHFELEWCEEAEEYDTYDYSYQWIDYEYFYDTIAQFNFLHPDLISEKGYEYKYYYKKENRYREWSYMNANFICENEKAVLGLTNDSLINFIRLPYGDGHFYLHSTPLAFTNINLLKEHQLDYFNKVFQHLPAGDIYMDYASHVSVDVARRNNDEFAGSEQHKNLSTEHPMKYILSQPALRWAWYLLLLLALLYLIFRAKRQQRVIPILAQNENSSLEFIQTIGRLNFLKNNHKQAVQQQMKLWQTYVRERYQISPKSEGFVAKLAAKAKFPEERLQKILLINQNIEASTYASENVLIEFHRLLEDFYKNAK